MNDNILKVAFGGSRMVTSNALWQYDYGQILQIKGINLPEMYEVHFANAENGNSKTSIGDVNGVPIPDEYLDSGEDIFAWVYLHTGVNDGETEYKIHIPVKTRAFPTHETPTPVQQSEIERLIALCEEIVEHGGGGSGEDGFSPIVTVTEITGGHRISIQDKTHTATFDVMDGTNGTNGTDGTDGVSPTVTVTSITGGHRVTITDADHPSGMQFDVMDGSDYVLTAQDKSDIADLVLAQIPYAEEVGF